MSEFLAQPAILVHIAAIFYVAGFLVRDQLLLRVLIFMGTLCYLVYYYFAAAQPLWEAFIWSVIMGAANLFIIVQLILERTTWTMNEEDKALYVVFDAMQPGEFRRLMRCASRHQCDDLRVLLHEGEAVENLYYITNGHIEITKGDTVFPIDPQTFVGEAGFFLNQNASATVSVCDGAQYICWDGESLRTIQRKYPSIRAAIHSILNIDMAKKVANSTNTQGARQRVSHA